MAAAGGEESVVSSEPNVVSEPASVAEVDSLSRQLGAALSLARLRGYFVDGMRLSAMVFLVIGAIFGGRRLFMWARRKYM